MNGEEGERKGEKRGKGKDCPQHGGWVRMNLPVFRPGITKYLKIHALILYSADLKKKLYSIIHCIRLIFLFPPTINMSHQRHDSICYN